MRQEVERKIITACVDALLQAGFTLSVSDYDDDDKEIENPITDSSDKSLDTITQWDDCYLWVHHADDASDESFGWIRFIYGNDGWDVINDYTVNLEPYMAEAQRISKHYEG